MQKKYNIGDKVWVARHESIKKVRPCPICFGKKEVTIILGDGSEVATNCSYCGLGQSFPTGEETYYEYTSKPELITVTDIESKETANGTEYEYKSKIGAHIYTCLTEENTFDTEEEAYKRGLELREEKEKKESEQTKHKRNTHIKNFAQHAGYWLREAKRSREDAERYEKYAHICKSRARKAE